MTVQTIDVHAHILAEDTMALWRKETPQSAPKLTMVDDAFGVLEVAGVPYRPFPKGGFDLETRLADMDAAEVEVQRPARHIGEGAPGSLSRHGDLAHAGPCPGHR
jgi:hypothetical protein